MILWMAMHTDKIDGVIIKDITTHSDARGFFREILRIGSDCLQVDAGQLSHSLVNSGVLKAWHYHKKQSQWNYIACGEVLVVLYDYRKDSPTAGNKITLRFGEGLSPKAYFFPHGVLHGYKCLKGPMHVFYVTSGTYDPQEEGRLVYNHPEVRYNWDVVNQDENKA
jgi:dTDP-4-dehydrorhamnose 3,5-epimerase